MEGIQNYNLVERAQYEPRGHLIEIFINLIAFLSNFGIVS